MFEAVYVINLAYAALLTSTFTRTLTRLRSMLIVGAVCFVVYGAVEGIRSMVVWNVVIGSLHASRLIRDARTRREVQLSFEERMIREVHFPDLSEFDFHALWAMGAADAPASGDVLIERGSQPESVSLVLDGSVAVQTADGAEVELGSGFLFGEMSFVSGKAADATVIAGTDLRIRRWEQRKLATLDQVHPPGARALRKLIAADLTAKIR